MRSSCTLQTDSQKVLIAHANGLSGPAWNHHHAGHDEPESVVTINQNARSRSAGMSGHDPPESPVTTNQNDWSRSSGIPRHWLSVKFSVHISHLHDIFNRNHKFVISIETVSSDAGRSFIPRKRHSQKR